ncbi:MAG: PKD domain-containing protein [Candidatus Bathyarchaeota archaeon]|nr:PKD domain-containing protein [Candidatus Bathyarchaeota archaeon]
MPMKKQYILAVITVLVIGIIGLVIFKEEITSPDQETDILSPIPVIMADEEANQSESVQFDASSSSDNVGIVSYEWDFGSGDQANGESVSYAFPNYGDFRVELKVTDKAGNKGTVYHTIKVYKYPVCSEIFSGPHRCRMLQTLYGNVGKVITLDAGELFGVTHWEQYEWTQVSPSQEDLLYTSHHKLSFQESKANRVNVTASNPGVYRIILDGGPKNPDDELVYEFELKVVDELNSTMKVKGINFVDLFGETGGPSFDINPVDPECQREVFRHAFDAPLRVGANYVGFVSAVFITEVEPVPLLEAEGNDLSLTDEEFYAELVGAAKQNGFKVMQTESYYPGVFLSSEEWTRLEEMKENPIWWAEFFDQYKEWVVSRAARAEKYGVDLFIPCLFADDTMRPDVYPEYDERWREILQGIREVYSGEIGFSVINPDDRLNFLDEIDALQITVFGGLYTSKQGEIADVHNPTMEELVNITEGFFHYPENVLADNVSIHYILTFASADAQNNVEDPSLRGAMDFAEQALYYEAFFTALEGETWVDGVISERWDYWDEWRRTGDNPEAAYFDESTGSTPRNKPAEDVINLWFDMW